MNSRKPKTEDTNAKGLPTFWHRCVFRKSVTGRFGIVTAEIGSVTGYFGDVTDGHLMAA